jgi:protein involved in polysaccharide export with SLBB domain
VKHYAISIAISGICGTRAAKAQTTQRCALLPALIALLLLPGMEPCLFAQAPAFPAALSGRTVSGSSMLQGQSGQYRVCSPADYGDPTADCVPVDGQSPYSTYNNNDYGSLDSPSGFPPAANRMQLPQSNMDLQNERAAGMPPAAPVHYEREPPTEFQRYVAESIGKVLPIFGASLFEGVPATFAPLDRASVGTDYLIAPGDELQIAIWGQFNATRRVVVSRTGDVVLPDVGPVSVAGMNYSQAVSALKASFSRLYKNFDLNVTLGRLHTIQVFVVGEARRPGSYSVSSLSTLVNAIFASGGPSSRGSMRRIELKRGGQTICEFDLYELLQHGDKTKDAQLRSGDVILIPPAGPRVALAGSVEHQGIYELSANTSVGQALRLADGPSPLAATSQVLLERVVDGTALRIFRLPMNSQGLRTELHNGDIIRLQPLVPRFEKAVILRGNVADAGRFPWKDGMRLSDLIPDKESLLTREYWKQRNALVVPQDSAPQEELDGSTPAPAGEAAEKPPAIAAALSNKLLPVTYQEQQRNTKGDNSLGAATEVDNTPPLRTFNPRNTVEPLAPEINWEYAVLERTDPVTLATRKVPFNLGKLVIHHDMSQDLVLEPGDIVTIFSKADFAIPRSQQVKEVRLEGEIAMAGVYTLLPGETLRQVVARAGGLTKNAYLYGAQFTRESTRRIQQKRYDDFLNQFERDVSEAASNLSSRVTSPQQAATAQTSLASQHDMIDRLRKVAMNGRIVLDIDPQGKGISSLPDLALENGDRLYVPSRPSTVSVVGNVFEQTSFLYQEDFRSGDYLKKAGGPARAADRSHMFVIRADGSVISRTLNSPLFGKRFDELAMFPGDTLVVPTSINRGTIVRDLMDWSQIFSGLALGAAAVNVLH